MPKPSKIVKREHRRIAPEVPLKTFVDMVFLPRVLAWDWLDEKKRQRHPTFVPQRLRERSPA
jgi:hypothetical protein